jgi:NAD dependent epimerase/dehydratase family enzyme
MFAMALKNENMHGPYNAVAPKPVSNAEFGKAIARALKRPALLRLPVQALRIILGEAGQYASGGPRVRGEKIQNSGYRFFFSDLDQALGNLLA